MKKRILFIIVCITFIILCGLSIFWKENTQMYAKLVDKPFQVKKWEADQRPLQTKEQAQSQIEKIFKYNKELDVDEIETIIIPGLRGAWSINPKTKKAEFGNDWVPQGLTQSKDNYYVSAYDGDHKLNSLIFQIGKKTKQYKKTLILDSKAHVGGITYDSLHERLFYSDDTNKSGGFGYVSKQVIDSYDASEVKAPIQSSYIEWHLGDRTSAITIFKNQLVVAKYGQNVDTRSIISIPLNRKGLPRPVTKQEMLSVGEAVVKLSSDSSKKGIIKEAGRVLEERGYISSLRHGWDRMQGISISDSGITVISQSNGGMLSNLIIRSQTSNPKTWSSTSFEDTFKGAKEIKAPRAVEEVSINDEETQIAMIFESGAKKYRQRKVEFLSPNFMDRIIILPISISV